MALHALCCLRSDSRGHEVIVQLLSVYNVQVLLQTETLVAGVMVLVVVVALVMVNAGKKLAVASM